MTELTAHRTLALREAVANDPDTAFLAMLHALCLKLFYRFGLDSCLEVEAKSVLFGAQIEGLGDMPYATAIDARHGTWAAQLPKDTADLWDVLSGLDGDSRQALFAHCVGLTINATCQPYDRRPKAIAHADRVAEAVQLDMAAAGWRPTVAGYLGRVTKAQILEAVREAKGEQAAQLIEDLKKADMAREAERLLEGSGWLPEPLRLRGADACRHRRRGRTPRPCRPSSPMTPTTSRAPSRRSSAARGATSPAVFASKSSQGSSSPPAQARRRAALCRKGRRRGDRLRVLPVAAKGHAPPPERYNLAPGFVGGFSSAGAAQVFGAIAELPRLQSEREGRTGRAGRIEREPAGSVRSPHLRGFPHDDDLRRRGRRAALPRLRCPKLPIVRPPSSAPPSCCSPDLERGHRIDAAMLRSAMEQAFGGSDAQGAWDWKSAYDACEAAAVLFLRRFGGAMAARAGSPAALLPMLAKVARPAPEPHAALRGERDVPAVLHAAPAGVRGEPRRPRSRRPTTCWSRRPAPACSPSSPSLPAPRSS